MSTHPGVVMTASYRRAIKVFLGISGLYFVPHMASGQSQATWIGPSGGSWSVASHWSGGRVPDGDARIDASPLDKTVVIGNTVYFNTLTIDSGDAVHVLAKADLGVVGPSITNAGAIQFIPTPSSSIFKLYPDQALAITGGGRIDVDGSLHIFNDASTPVVNVDNALRGGILIYSSLENAGTISAPAGRSVVVGVIDSSIRNTGRMVAENQGVVLFWGPVENAGGTIEAEDGGIVQIGDRGFAGGVLKTSGSGIVTFPYGDNIRDISLSDFTLDGVLRFGAPAYGNTTQTTRLRGAIHNVGTIDVVPVGRTATLEFGTSGQPVTLSGGGWINLGSAGSSLLHGYGLYTDNTIRGSGRMWTNVVTTGRIIAASGGLLRLSSPVVSTGTIQVESGGYMRLAANTTFTSTGGAIQIDPGGTFSLNSSAATVNLTLNAGSLELDGMLDMQNGTLNATHVAGTGVFQQSGGQINATHLRISGASISGGTTKITPGGGSLGTSRLGTLSVTDAGRLDLSHHDLILDYPADAPVDPTQIRSLLASAYTDGSWSGPGLTSSAAAASGPSNRTALGYLDNTDAAFTEFSGQSVDDTSVLVKYTLAGDATFDGLVNLADLIALANHWQMQGFWVDGDFDYNGVIDHADLGLLAGNWNGSIDDALQAVGLDGVPIPEPAAGCLILAPALVIRRRRS